MGDLAALREASVAPLCAVSPSPLGQQVDQIGGQSLCFPVCVSTVKLLSCECSSVSGMDNVTLPRYPHVEVLSPQYQNWEHTILAHCSLQALSYWCNEEITGLWLVPLALPLVLTLKASSLKPEFPLEISPCSSWGCEQEVDAESCGLAPSPLSSSAHLLLSETSS